MQGWQGHQGPSRPPGWTAIPTSRNLPGRVYKSAQRTLPSIRGPGIGLGSASVSEKRTTVKKQIKDALAHYRCPACGKVDLGFMYEELRVVEFRFNSKATDLHYQWPKHDSNRFEDSRYDREAYFDGDHEFVTEPVRCANCEVVVCKPDGSPLTIRHFDKWLEDLGQRWEAQVRERAVLKAELSRVSATLPPVGTIAPLEKKIKA